MLKKERKMIAKNRLYEIAWKYVRALNGDGDFDEARARLFEAIDLIESMEILTEAETHKVFKKVHDEYNFEEKQAC
jgi:hypothetical protein